MKYYVTYMKDGDWEIKLGTYDEIETFMYDSNLDDGIYLIDKSPKINNSTFIKKAVEQKKLEADRLNWLYTRTKMREDMLKDEESYF